MLGAQTWFVAFAVPTVAVGSFIATRKRLAFQWRDELMDPEGNIYPTVTDKEMHHIRRVSSASEVKEFEESGSMNVDGKTQTSVFSDRASSTNSSVREKEFNQGFPVGHPLSVEDNMGWFLSQPGEYAKVYGDVCLEEVKRLAVKFGIGYDQRKIDALKKQIALEKELSRLYSSEISVETFSENQVLSDHAEDTRLMKAPWGSGDALRTEKMPLLLRHLSRQIQQVFPDLGRLRHVYVEYAPLGQFYKEPKSPKLFDGHDFVVIPLRRDRLDSVITFVPSLRSKLSSLHDVMKYSWTSRDVDVRIPNGAMLRVYGRARYDWGWGIRPGRTWWGCCLQPMASAQFCTGEEDGIHKTSPSSCSSLLSTVFQKLGLPLKNKKNTNSVVISSQKDGSDAALLFFHFEGPRSKGKKRSLLFHPESLIFGFPPQPENFEKWEEDRPTEEQIRKIGVVKFLAQNYLSMFRVS